MIVINKTSSIFKLYPQIIFNSSILIILLIIKYILNNNFIFHSIIEIYGLIIASSLFIIISNSKKIQKNHFYLIIGKILFFITILNLFQYLLSNENQYVVFINKKQFDIFLIIRCLLIILIIFFSFTIFIKDKFILNKSIFLFIMVIILLIIITELLYNKFSNDILSTISYFIKFILYFILYKTLVNKVLNEPIVSLIKDMETKEIEYKTILDNTNDLIILTKDKGEIFYINSACKKILEYEQKDLLNKNIKYIYKESKDKISEILKINSGFDHEFNIKTLNGKNKNILHSWNSITINNEKIIINIIKDITFIKQFEKDKNKFLKELSEKNKDIEQIIYIISHDLRTPLTNIQGFTKAIFYSLDKIINFFDNQTISKNIKDNIKNIFDNEIPLFKNYIENSVIKIDSLITGLLKLSQIGRSILNLTAIDTNKLLKEVLALFKYQIQIENINVKIQKLPSCYGDIVHINQVFSNLIDNAIKFQDEKKQKSIKIYGRKTKDKIIYCIEDNGIGIEKKHQKEIFEIFKKINPNKTAGEGLGLTITKKILNKHNGDIKVDSKIGKGSKFYIYLPRLNL